MTPTPPPAESQALVVGRSLAARAGGQTLFEGLYLVVRRGELIALTGPNGSGKSTLLRILLGLQPPAAGTVERAQGLAVGYVPQLDPGDAGLPFPAVSVASQALPFAAIRPRARRAAREAVASALARVGFRAPPGRRYTVLSGGERRRVLLARALARAPDLLALDEPTAGVDAEGESHVIDLVRAEIRSRGVGAIWVCHGLAGVEEAADRVIRLGAPS